MKIITILMMVFVITAAPVLAEETSQDLVEPELEAEAYLEQLRVKQSKEIKAYIDSLSIGKNGRFQATQIIPDAVLILDTKEGHMWIWAQDKTTYQGRLFPNSDDMEFTPLPSEE